MTKTLIKHVSFRKMEIFDRRDPEGTPMVNSYIHKSAIPLEEQIRITRLKRDIVHGRYNLKNKEY